MDQEQLERYEFQMGGTRGKLAMDLQIILQCMNESKELILKAMEASKPT